MKNTHLTLRLPSQLARALARRARERDVPKSQLAREAVASYLAAEPQPLPRSVSALDLAARWSSLPRLTPPEAASLAADIAAARSAVPAVGAPWE